MSKNLDKDYEIDLKEFLFNLLQRKLLILISAFIFMLIFSGYRYTLEEKNKINIKIKIDPILFISEFDQINYIRYLANLQVINFTNKYSEIFFFNLESQKNLDEFIKKNESTFNFRYETNFKPISFDQNKNQNYLYSYVFLKSFDGIKFVSDYIDFIKKKTDFKFYEFIKNSIKSLENIITEELNISESVDKSIKLDKDPKNKSLNRNYFFNLTFDNERLEYYKSIISNKLISLEQNFESSNDHYSKYIESEISDKKNILKPMIYYTFFGFFFGLIFSILIIFFRSIT